MKPVAIAFTVYPVTDVPRARAFYEQVLGLTPTQEMGSGEQMFIEYDLGPHTLAIGRAPGFVPGSTGAKAAIEVEDFPAAVARLRERQVSFVFEPIETPVCHMAAFNDPDGNVLFLHQRKPDLKGPAIVDQ